MKTVAMLCMLWGVLSSSFFMGKNTTRSSFHDEFSKESLPHIERNSLPVDVYHNKAIQYATEGLACLRETQPDLINQEMVIIDYSLPSSLPRLIVYDAAKKKISLRMHVAHGKGSGLNQALSFSNEPSSFKSSLGFFKVGEPYYGKHGLAFRLIGLEPGINDKAYERGIVIHAAEYVENKFIQALGRTGRSLGCPAVSSNDLKKLIPVLQKNRLLFIYAPQWSYFKHSSFFR